MCIGIPMLVTQIEPGHALCIGRGEQRRVRTALIDAVQPGDWVLVFLDSAQEQLSEERARDINATLDLLAGAFEPAPPGATLPEASFDLPSRLSQSEVHALATGSIGHAGRHADRPTDSP